MATEKSFQLYINDDNVKQYFSASGGALNGAAIGGKYITMRTSSTTAIFTMNDAGRDVLFPSKAAIAHKIDVWVQSIATLNSSKNTLDVAIAGHNAITTERIRNSLTEHEGSVSGNFTKSDTSAVYVVKIANGFIGAGVRDTSITAYFNQYACEAKITGRGIKSASVSNSTPYEGETITFSVELYDGTEFGGWYSDEACTNLVSGSLTHSTPAADLVLYAKGSLDSEIYSCAAVAGENIASATVSESSVVSGKNVTFSATLNEGCLFDGWYSDSSYTNLVSTENPYAVAITADTTLYAKAHKKQFTMSVGAAEHGVASVSSLVASYGDTVSLTFTPNDATWELYGWYSDEALTQLVSADNPYEFMVTADVVLYPKVGIKRCTITLQSNGSLFMHSATTLSIIATYTNQLTKEDMRNLRAGVFSAISSEKVIAIDTLNKSYMQSYFVSVFAPIGSTVAMYAEAASTNAPYKTVYFNNNDERITNGPHLVVVVTGDSTYTTCASNNLPNKCICTAVALDGVEYAEAYPKTVEQEYNTTFSAEVLDGYRFEGWYSDEACTTLVTVNNPVKVTAPAYSGDTEAETSLILYAKGVKASSGSGLYLKTSSSYIEAKQVYEKINGVWTVVDKTVIDLNKKYKLAQ